MTIGLSPRLTAVILAAGAGSRLGELGKRFSKPMVPLGGRPLIDWGIERLRAAGVERFVVVAHPDDAQLADFLRVTHPHAVVVRQPQRRGIADALACALPEIAPVEGYLACACDSLFPVAEIRELMARGARVAGSAVVGVLEMGVEATTTRSSVRFAPDSQGDSNRIVEIVEKPSVADAPSGFVALPLYWLPRQFAPCLRDIATLRGETHVSTALTHFARGGGSVLSSPISQRLEITTAADVESVASQLLGVVPAAQ